MVLDGRTTGIEPAHGGFTIHCLDPLGYIRPYPRALVSVSIVDQIKFNGCVNRHGAPLEMEIPNSVK